jgi:hypothetical protein
MKHIYFFTILIFLLLILVLSMIAKSDNKEEYNDNTNINEEIEKRYQEYKRNIDKYRVGVPKFYKFHVKPNEQPYNGLGPEYNSGYPSSLPKGCNNMIPSKSQIDDYPFVNLLNEQL